MRRLLQVDKETFNAVLQEMNSTLLSFLAQINMLKPLCEDELLTLSKGSSEMAYSDGTKVISKGDVTDRAIYIILDGTVLVKRGEDQSDIPLGRGTSAAHPASWVGEASGEASGGG
jgi:CRP-like cAMP-binding protein